MQPKTLWDKKLGHMSIQSKFQLSRASKSKTATWKLFSIVAAPQFTEQLKQLWSEHTVDVELFIQLNLWLTIEQND